LKRDRSTEHSCELENHHDEIEGLKEELEELNKELKSFGQQRFSSVKEKALKNKQKDQMKKGWPMINAVKKHLLIFGLFDFSL
jgi:cell division septum initiation protein DivIVA